ncbi:lipoate--protein ligase [Latilactobacillus fuchuensis]|uniref:lipoate--protein ligase n=1 Tax=Latilactobacillus fuchuensis TaxID=164393 RepID=A0A2N9DVF8_9LACO|nr:lipoate--protein ligase [Latilactobacillus fuchuensis]MCP8856870.1 lipoate--protein ligase [Latilactobacillus fuchuensis]SPC38479.1 Lipoate-protein ligase LplJ [Latilactobacillus fuchuensis]
MYYVVMPSNDIRRNLATEQYLMNQKHFDEPLLLFYIEKPCIIVGRNQNTFEEINQQYVEGHNITVTRRLSGGGGIYQDLGNLCFSFVVDADSEQFGDFKSFTQPIVDALHQMGATSAEVSGRNDMLVAGKKFSGNAMYTKNGKTFSHGTLSWDVDLDVLTQALNVPADKIASKGIKSIRQRVTNLKPHVDSQYQNMTTEEFRDVLLLNLFHATDLAAISDRQYQLTDADQAGIDQLFNDIYSNWDWVYGKSPNSTVQKRQHFDFGTIDARLLIEQGKIANVKFYGDFFGSGDANELAKQLQGTIYDRQHLTEALADIDTTPYFTGIPKTELVTLLAQ